MTKLGYILMSSEASKDIAIIIPFIGLSSAQISGDHILLESSTGPFKLEETSPELLALANGRAGGHIFIAETLSDGSYREAEPLATYSFQGLFPADHGAAHDAP